MTAEENIDIDMVFGSKRNRVSLGILCVVLGIAGALVTYKYTPPIGSVILIVCGLIMIFCWEWWMTFVREKIHGH